MVENEVLPLTVQTTEMYSRENAEGHHTAQFEVVSDPRPTPVLRRGQPFYIGVRFDRVPDLQQDGIRLIFNFGMFSLLFLKSFVLRFHCEVIQSMTVDT